MMWDNTTHNNNYLVIVMRSVVRLYLLTLSERVHMK